MGKRAGERETEEQENTAAAAAGTPGAKKRRSGSPSTTDGASSGPGGAAGLCDDVVGNILARVPARTAVASMALSTRHRRLIRSPEFRSLHRRLAPPLPRPHIAFLVTATVRTQFVKKDEVHASAFQGFHHVAGAGKLKFNGNALAEVPASVFQGFHVASAGGFNGNAPAAMHALAGPRFSDVEYVNTCNGIVVLAAGTLTGRRCKCILWNPAVVDVVEEVSVPDADADDSTDVKEYRTLGLGYGQRSKTYKLVLLCRRRMEAAAEGGTRYHYSLVTYALADLGKQKQPTTEIELPAVQWDSDISQNSLYMDSKIYLLHCHIRANPVAILAFDVDDETVTSIDLPMARDARRYGSTSGLMEHSGRPCVVTGYDGGGCALWQLSVDLQWHRRCLIGEPRSGRIYPDSVIGAWDCGGVLVLCCSDDSYNAGRLFLYDLTAGKMFRACLESVVALESSDFALCWGYRPSLEAPSSVVDKLQQDRDCSRERLTHIMKALKPVADQDRKKGQEATLNIVCFMDFLVNIMRRLPKDMQQVLEMKMMDSDDPNFTFENVLFED